MTSRKVCKLAFICLLTLLNLQIIQAAGKDQTYLAKSQDAYAKKDFSTSLHFIQKHLSENQNDPFGHYFKGLILYAEGNNEESVKCFEYSIKLDPDQAKPWTGLGKGLYSMQSYQKSLDAFKTAVKKSPNDHENYLYLGKSLYYLKAYSVAVRCFDKAIELDPKNKEAKTLRGSCLDKIAFQNLVLLKAKTLVEINNLTNDKSDVKKNQNPKKDE